MTIILRQRNPPNPLITTNITFFNKWLKNSDYLSLAAHWLHKWLHVAGFRHINLQDGTPDRNDVTYQIGKFVITIGREGAREGGKDEDIIINLGKGYIEDYERYNSEIIEDI